MILYTHNIKCILSFCLLDQPLILDCIFCTTGLFHFKCKTFLVLSDCVDETTDYVENLTFCKNQLNFSIFLT